MVFFIRLIVPFLRTLFVPDSRERPERESSPDREFPLDVVEGGSSLSGIALR